MRTRDDPVLLERELKRRLLEAPGEASHHLALAALYDELGRPSDMRAAFEHMVRCIPDDATAHFNLGCCLRREGRLEEALAAHHRALALNVSGAEEVWSNIAVILSARHRHEEARAALEQALSLNPDWLPAQYNLGLWWEEHGNRAAALACFSRVLSLDPDHAEALARTAMLQGCTGADDPVLAEIGAMLGRTRDPAVRESLLFARGKLLGECGLHEQAAQSFELANRFASMRTRPYDRERTEAFFRSIRDNVGAQWLSGGAGPGDAGERLVFVCGMFRSGTTLMEQCLTGHAGVASIGESAFFHARLLGPAAPAFPGSWLRDSAARNRLATDYLAMIDASVTQARRVIDKRPDNFLFLGLLAALFPRARFVHMRRDARDVCVSLWMQQLSGYLDYANDLRHAAHYHGQYEGLMAHWRGIAGERIIDIDYEALVREPEPVLRSICEFLGLEWTPDMARPHERAGRVRTASLWQVREPIHDGVIGRWRHHAKRLADAGFPVAETGDTHEH
jgi:tetratricopeptide (TPR) repeat protein